MYTTTAITPTTFDFTTVNGDTVTTYKTTARLADWGRPAPFDTDGEPRYKFHVTIKNEDGQRAQFNFWSSIADYRTGKNELLGTDLADAVRAILYDALLGTDLADVADYFSEFGGDENDRAAVSNAKRVVKGCQATLAKVTALGISLDEASAVVDAIQEAE